MKIKFILHMTPDIKNVKVGKMGRLDNRERPIMEITHGI